MKPNTHVHSKYACISSGQFAFRFCLHTTCEAILNPWCCCPNEKLPPRNTHSSGQSILFRTSVVAQRKLTETVSAPFVHNDMGCVAFELDRPFVFGPLNCVLNVKFHTRFFYLFESVTPRSLFRLATGIGEGQQEPSTAGRRETKLEKAKRDDGSTKLQNVTTSTMILSLFCCRWVGFDAEQQFRPAALEM